MSKKGVKRGEKERKKGGKKKEERKGGVFEEKGPFFQKIRPASRCAPVGPQTQTLHKAAQAAEKYFGRIKYA